MNLDEDLHDRFSNINPEVANLGSGATAARNSSARRTAAGRAIAAGFVVVAFVACYSAFSNLTNDASELQTTDPSPDETQDSVPPTEDDSPTSSVPSPEDTSPPLSGTSTAVPTTEDPEAVVVHEDVGPSEIEFDATVSNIVGVDENDTLNARSGSGTDFDVLFEFPPDATGVVHTGAVETSSDGATWVEVFAPASGAQNDSGWVNAAFLTETSVTDAQPCLFNGPQDHYIGIDWTNTAGRADSDAAVITNIETYRFGGCIRTVFEFSNGWSYQDGGAQRVATLPTDIVVTRHSDAEHNFGALIDIDFGASINGAEVVSARFIEPMGVDHSTFAAMAGPDRRIEGTIYGPTSVVSVRFDNAKGRVIVDVADIDVPLDADPELLSWVGANVQPIINEEHFVLTGVSSSGDRARWSFAGLARPFEATLGVDIIDTEGAPIDVTWTNGVNSVGASNGVNTSTWTEALGQFEFSVTLPSNVDPADIIVRFDPGGAGEGPPLVELALADFVGS